MLWNWAAKARRRYLRGRNDDKVLSSVVFQHRHIRLLVFQWHESRDFVAVFRCVFLFPHDVGRMMWNTGGQKDRQALPVSVRVDPGLDRSVGHDVLFAELRLKYHIQGRTGRE